jgi:hypothetical protein
MGILFCKWPTYLEVWSKIRSNKVIMTCIRTCTAAIKEHLPLQHEIYVYSFADQDSSLIQ